ncbi:cysteine-rich KTR domain-containing protein [Parablautia intestinalis]|uniref:cysteine-rich KTR domain-containing protein n=1 Tax=Parablautia intestinalis TaxID=2320100 RepID=UPI00256EEBC7|nr:cysteine-rich KTR domain-containing protein [Parablautia intestinalis]
MNLGNLLHNKRIEWIYCPICGSKICDKIRKDTVLKNYPFYCLKCKKETLSSAKNLQITVIKEPDA